MTLFRRCLLAFMLCLVASPLRGDHGPPPLPREFRGVWVATVANIDWPSRPGLPVEEQKEELLAILDRAAALNFNAVVFQVRPAGDALYQSSLEPWSEFLTGTQGQTPEPFYDPLEFAVRHAHARGLQLHAWINPYRARYRRDEDELAETHLGRTHPDLVKEYGRYLWMDPGEPAVRKHSLAVARDIVTRYDVDGIHMDDYFYPYQERDEEGEIIDFPDDASYQKYRRGGGTLARDDWRRRNVDLFIQGLYESVKAKRPEVLVGLSPFGIWRPGHPPQIQGFDAYAGLYADSRKWFRQGWCDYLTPQLYWPVGQTAQDYIALQNWWMEQNTKRRHLWPGLYTSRFGRQWEPVEIVKQIEATREASGATGNIHFSMKSLMQDRGGLEQAIKKLYAEPALVPASPWLDGEAPSRPEGASFSQNGKSVTWPANDETARWAVQFQNNGHWHTRILPSNTTTFAPPEGAEKIFLTAVGRTSSASEPVPVNPEKPEK